MYEWWSHNSDINEFIDKLRSDNLDSIHRAIYSFCWRDLFWRRSGGLRRVGQMCQTNPSASSSRANYPPETETNLWVSSKTHNFNECFSLPQWSSMPSTHSATIVFYGTYITLACTWLPLHASLPQSPFLRPLAALATITWACVVASSRILLGHHTAPQVIAGCIYGLTFACVWFWPWTHGLSNLGHIVERHIRVYIG